MPPTNTYYNAPIDPIIIIYFNYRKKGHFVLFYLKLKNINNIKEIEKKKFNELGKKESEEKTPF